jgi:hypothetical protein
VLCLRLRLLLRLRLRLRWGRRRDLADPRLDLGVGAGRGVRHWLVVGLGMRRSRRLLLRYVVVIGPRCDWRLGFLYLASRLGLVGLLLVGLLLWLLLQMRLKRLSLVLQRLRLVC